MAQAFNAAHVADVVAPCAGDKSPFFSHPNIVLQHYGGR
jgi:hypothetical protein